MGMLESLFAFFIYFWYMASYGGMYPGDLFLLYDGVRGLLFYLFWCNVLFLIFLHSIRMDSKEKRNKSSMIY